MAEYAMFLGREFIQPSKQPHQAPKPLGEIEPPLIYTPLADCLGEEEKLSRDEILADKQKYNVCEPSTWDPFLRVGHEIYLSTGRKIKRLRVHESFRIKPGEFALILTKERIILPHQMAAMINLRLSYKARGLVNISGFHVDPGYKGHLMFSVFNAGPEAVIVREGDPLFMILFAGFVGTRSSDSDKTKHRYSNGIWALSAEAASQLQGLIPTLPELQKQVQHLQVYVYVAYGIIVPLILAVVATLIRG